MLRRACPVPAPLGPLASTLPVRSYRCASLLIPASCRSGVRPGTSQCPSGSVLGQGLDAVALPQMPDSPPPRDPASHPVTADRFAPLLAGCSRSSSSRTALGSA